jgi:chromosome segregation ATPase
MDDINSFIDANLKIEFELLDELQNNCNSSVKLFSALTGKVDPKELDKISDLIDKLNLANYQVTKLKNNIAMKSYKREMILKNDLLKTQEQFTKLETGVKDSEKKTAELKAAVKETEKLSTNFEAKALETENKLAKLEEDIKKSEGIISDFEAENEDLSAEIEELTKERDELKKKGGKQTIKPIINPKYLHEFNKRDLQLKNELRDEIKKWNKLKTDFSKLSKKTDKDSEKAFKEAEKKIEALETELADKEKKLKSKKTKNRAQLEKQRKNVKQKLTTARKKYEALKENLKKDYKDSEKAEKIKNEIEGIVDKIDMLQKEYDALSKDIDVDKDTLFTLFESLARITDKAPANFKELLKKSNERESKLESQLNVAIKNVEELQKEMEDMDTDYHSEIKTEFDRLAKKEGEKYKKLLKKQEEKYKKELEVAARTMFELKQYIEELEQIGEKVPVMEQVVALEEPSKASTGRRGRAGDLQEFNQSSSPYANVAELTDEQNSRRGLPMKLPKNQVQKPAPKGKGKGKVRKKKQKKRKFEMGKCGSCDEYIPIDSTSCPECGATFEIVDEELVVCGNCGETIPATVKVCPACDAKFE